MHTSNQGHNPPQRRSACSSAETAQQHLSAPASLVSPLSRRFHQFCSVPSSPLSLLALLLLLLPDEDAEATCKHTKQHSGLGFRGCDRMSFTKQQHQHLAAAQHEQSCAVSAPNISQRLSVTQPLTSLLLQDAVATVQTCQHFAAAHHEQRFAAHTISHRAVSHPNKISHKMSVTPKRNLPTGHPINPAHQLLCDLLMCRVCQV